MEGRQSRTTNGASVLDVKPLRSLSPLFPASLGFTASTTPGAPSFLCITPFGPSGQSGQPGFTSASPYFTSVDPPANNTCKSKNNGTAHGGGYFHAGGSMNGRSSSHYQTPPAMVMPLNEDDGMCKQHSSSSGRALKRPTSLSGYGAAVSGSEGSKKKKPRKKFSKPQDLVISKFDDPRESVNTVLMIFDALRRRQLQIDEVDSENATRRQDLKVGAIMMDIDLRVNRGKIMGSIPGVNIGDIFYFRMELCLVGLHAPSMAGIDYMSTKLDSENDTLAISIVSSGGYEDESDDVDILIYTGQGGSKSHDSTKQIDDQKLERGNLALERSLHRGNQVRVIRAAKDLTIQAGKIYFYDGLYKIKESWAEKGKAGFNVFKYKLQREPGQAAGFSIWKMTEKWRENSSSRGRVILHDISSGEESFPVCLVNEVDSEKGPELFSYSTKGRYLRPISSMKLLQGCNCNNVCLPGDSGCTCAQKNGGNLPYGPTGLLVSRKPLIYECGSSCQCSANCRNRVTQKGTKLRFEVFRTTNRGWGLRSWDPIRAGTFVCEYTGDVIDLEKIRYNGEDDDYIIETNHAADKSFKWNHIPELLEGPIQDDLEEESEPLPIIISAKRIGNISRFMNHSCSPNVFWQPVQHDHGDEGYPHVMFFAIKHIPPMTELTYDYGQSGCKPKQCLCGSGNCRGTFG